MKKELNKLKVIKTNNIKDINIKLQYPYTKEMYSLLKQENKFNQEYFYLKKGKDFAFFSIYENKMNIFTFGKLELYMKLKVIGYPCSLSNCGYVTNNEEMMIDYIKTIKGAKLVLNVSNPKKYKNITIGETLPTCIFNQKYTNVNEYLNTLRASYRRRINKAINNTKDIKIKEINDNSIDIYNLYLNTYNKSNYKLEKLEKGFFEKINATKLVFTKNNKPVGFTLLKINNNKLIFMLCGMDYSIDTTDLYYLMLYKIVEYAIKHKCNEIDFGQTSEETKLKFGSILERKYFYIHHSNKLLNKIASLIKGLLEYKYKFPNYKVFKE